MLRWKRNIAAIVMILLAALSGTVTAQAAVKLNKKTAVMTAGTKLQLKVKGTKKKVTWKSSNKNVAKVNKKGLVTAKEKGSAKITATVDKKKYTCAITVLNNEFLGYASHDQAEMTGEGITFFISRISYSGSSLVCEGFFKNTMKLDVPAGTKYSITVTDGAGRTLAAGEFALSAVVAAGGYLDCALSFGPEAQPSGQTDLRLVTSAGTKVDMTITQTSTTTTVK